MALVTPDPQHVSKPATGDGVPSHSPLAMRFTLLPALLVALTAAAGCGGPDASDDAPTAALATGDSAEVSASAEMAVGGALGVGDRAPDFELPDIDGGTVQLSDLLANGPVVLTFYRGAWCPYCNSSLQGFQAELGDIMDAGGYLVAVSPQTEIGSQEMASSNALSFPVLSDAGNRVSRAFGLVFKVDQDTQAQYELVGIDLAAVNGSDAWELPVPATYVIDTDGTIRAAFVEADYTQRADPRDVIAALEQLT